METLKLDTRLKTAEPAVALDPGLPPGRYQVTLVVTSERGDSLPAGLLLTVVEPGTLDVPLSPLAAPKARPRKPRSTR